MKSQNQITNINENHDISFEAFSDAEKELNKYYAGMARIIDCELITDLDNIPDEYVNNYGGYLSYDKYIILKAEKDESTIRVIIPISKNDSTGDLDYCLRWTDVSSFDYLAGKRIPVKHIKNDIFRIERFNMSVLKYLPMRIIKYLINKNIIKQEIYGKWSLSSFYTVLLYTILLTPIFVISYSIGQYLSNSFMVFIIAYFCLYSLRKIFSR